MTEQLYNENSWLISVCEFISVNEIGYLKLVIHVKLFILKNACFSVTKLCWLFEIAWTVTCSSILHFQVCSNSCAIMWQLAILTSLHTVVHCYLLSVFPRIMAFCLCSLKPLNIIGKVAQCLDLIFILYFLADRTGGCCYIAWRIFHFHLFKLHFSPPQRWSLPGSLISMGQLTRRRVGWNLLTFVMSWLFCLHTMWSTRKPVFKICWYIWPTIRNHNSQGS